MKSQRENSRIVIFSALKVRSSKVGARKIRTLQLRRPTKPIAAQICALQICVCKVSFLEIRPLQLRIFEVNSSQVGQKKECPIEVRSAKGRVQKTRVTKVGTWKVHSCE